MAGPIHERRRLCRPTHKIPVVLQPNRKALEWNPHHPHARHGVNFTPLNFTPPHSSPLLHGVLLLDRPLSPCRPREWRHWQRGLHAAAIPCRRCTCVRSCSARLRLLRLRLRLPLLLRRGGGGGVATAGAGAGGLDQEGGVPAWEACSGKMNSVEGGGDTFFGGWGLGEECRVLRWEQPCSK